MAIKSTVHVVCPKCGRLNARQTSQGVWVGHKCPFAPPGPPRAPRLLELNSIILVSEDSIRAADMMKGGAK